MNLTGSVKMLDLYSYKMVTRDNFMLLLMPESVILVLNRLALPEGKKLRVRFTGGQDVVIDIDGHNRLPNTSIPANIDFQQQPIGLQEPPPTLEPTIGGDSVDINQAVIAQDNTQKAQEATQVATQDGESRAGYPLQRE